MQATTHITSSPKAQSKFLDLTGLVLDTGTNTKDGTLMFHHHCQ